MTLKLSTRLWTPTLVLIVMLVVMSVIAAVRTRSLIEAAGQASRDQQTRLTLAHQWQGEVSALEARLSAGAPAAEQPARIEALRQRLSPLATSEDERRTLARLATLPADLAGLTPYRAALTDLVTLEEQLAEALHVRTSQERMRTVWLVAGVSVLVAAALAVASTLLVRAICRPLAELARAARQIGEGDLRVQLDTTRPDEIGDVMRSVVAMRDGLRRTVGQMQDSAESIHTASREVASGNLDLSQRTERAAGYLQRTASGMQRLSETMHHSSAAASDADRLARDASDAAERGGASMQQLMSTMEEINQSSRRISDIIGVIDGIAFQTNILALNAAVEAARAGEQGRGFAVVASEVRTLAGRSAEAAREIRSLILSSGEKVDSGTQQVRETGERIGELAAAVTHVSQRVREITVDAEQQSSGILELHASVQELDQMTQQNAALVEQSAAAADSLQQQAARLNQAANSFHLDDRPRLAPAAATEASHARAAREVIAQAQSRAQSVPPAPLPAPARPSNAPGAGPSDDWESF
ncbi:HAMP domain-containing protein [Ideonella sp. 4Y16]|uniref:HAMP domain-containing protein n=1 Tax=Ideonella alba TaxID=2824118 RepID=A0A941BE84_9BURK|nr:methyl-accepting chemotaxis protein [Ideonella alba]MBQ0929702.1 HAMP domain-containing protein [Ideonella alba]MBQ0941943.1 HAMP domain-containing protein [Ideonella alba]